MTVMMRIGTSLFAVSDFFWISANTFERTIACAAADAHWNRYDIEASLANSLDLIENRGERAVMVGRFPGVAERYPGIAVVEREPRPGEYPESALADLPPKAQFVAITASANSNGSQRNVGLMFVRGTRCDPRPHTSPPESSG